MRTIVDPVTSDLALNVIIEFHIARTVDFDESWLTIRRLLDLIPSDPACKGIVVTGIPGAKDLEVSRETLDGTLKALRGLQFNQVFPDKDKIPALLDKVMEAIRDDIIDDAISDIYGDAKSK